MVKKCPVCGKEFSKDVAFCDECGYSFQETDDSGILQMKSDKYCWIYEQPMLKSFFLLFEVWRVLGITAVILIVLLMIINLLSGQGFHNSIQSVEMGLLVLLILLILSILPHLTTNLNI